jgi:hypothetical protein
LGHYNKAFEILAKKVEISKNGTGSVAPHSFDLCLREKGFSIDVIEETIAHQRFLAIKAYVRKFGVEVLDEAVVLL